jgi:hypothetical protein
VGAGISLSQRHLALPFNGGTQTRRGKLDRRRDTEREHEYEPDGSREPPHGGHAWALQMCLWPCVEKGETVRPRKRRKYFHLCSKACARNTRTAAPKCGQ